MTGNQKTILLAEDHHELRRMLSDLLQASGFRVVEAQDGPAALAHAEAGWPGIFALLTDHLMPGLTGAALIRELYRRGKAPGVVVLISSTADTDPEARGLSREFPIHMLTKPFDIAELLRLLA